MHRNARDAPDVVERHEALRADGNDAARLEHGALPRRLEDVGELALSHESQHGGLGHPTILWGYNKKPL